MSVLVEGNRPLKLSFVGHDYVYAVEQTLLALLPDFRPCYESAQAGDDCATLTLRCAGGDWVGECELTLDGKTARAASRISAENDWDALEQAREKQKIVKLSFFQTIRDLTGISPPWGALTGIRPGKLASGLLEEGRTEEEVSRLLEETYFVTEERRKLCLETAKAGIAAASALAPRDIALYLGIPFCPTRCAYCSFVSSSVEKSFALVEPYLAALAREIEAAGRLVRELGLSVRAFYMGGGTPTTLSAPQMDALLSRVEANFDLSRCLELTIEAGRPDTITPAKLEVLRRHNTTRISCNPQTMEDAVLRAIGRRHSAKDIVDAMALIREFDFPHVNMDLIAGLPEDTPAGFRRSLDQILTLGADNVTVHTLSLKKGSRITLEGLRIPAADAVGEMLSYASPRLHAAGFTPYYLYRQKYMSGSFENTGWCLPGSEGLYNIYIMEEQCSILSLGAGGSTKMVDAKSGHIERAFNLKFPLEYTNRPEKIDANHAAVRAFYQSLQLGK